MRRKGKDNPNGVVEGIRKAIQDLLVPELKAIQVTLQHHAKLIHNLQRQTEERFGKAKGQLASLRQEMNERFTKVWEAINKLVEGQQHPQMALQRILDLMDVTEMVRETQSRQKVVETQVKELREQVKHLRSMMEIMLRQRGIEPLPPP